MKLVRLTFWALLFSACCTIRTEQPILGWKEIADLPELGISNLAIKVDTGAKTSSLHAENLQIKERDGKRWVSFQFEGKTLEAELVTEKSVKNSGGMVTVRPTIRTAIRLGKKQWDILLTLVSREGMASKMLLGREGIPEGYLIDAKKGTNSGSDESIDHKQQSPAP